MSHHAICTYIVQHVKFKWCRGINVGPDIWRSLVRSQRWTCVSKPRNTCPNFLPGAGLEPMTFEWPISLTGLLTNLEQSLLKQGRNRFMLVKKYNVFFFSVFTSECQHAIVKSTCSTFFGPKHVTYLWKTLHWTTKKSPWAIVTCFVHLYFTINVCKARFSQMGLVLTKKCFWTSKNYQVKLSFKADNDKPVRNFKFMKGFWCLMWVRLNLHMQKKTLRDLYYKKIPTWSGSILTAW